MKAPDLEFTGEFLIPDKLPNIDWQDYQRHILRYLFTKKYVKDKIVLDIACGVGYGSYILAKEDAKKVIGGEIKSTLLDYANFYYKKENLSFIRLDCCNLPFSDTSFDLIVSFETIEHLIDSRKFLSECKRILKAGGLFICSTPNRSFRVYKENTPPFHLHEFNLKEFKSLLQDYFSKIQLFTQDYIPLSRYLLKFINKYSDALFTRIYRFLLKFTSKKRLKDIKESASCIFRKYKFSIPKEMTNKIDIRRDEIEKYIYTEKEVIDRLDSCFKVRRFKNSILKIPFEFIAICSKT
jgi:SAM-dependent methyltransferase